MAELVNLPSIPAFEIGEDSTKLAERWRKWKKSFEFLIVASGISCEERKRALLMCYGVPEIPAVLDVYATATSTLDNYFFSNAKYDI